MGINKRFADTRTAQEKNSVVQVTIPKDVAEELQIEGGDEVLWTGEEDADTAMIHAPNQS